MKAAPKDLVIPAAGLAILVYAPSAGLSLLAGMILALFFGNPFLQKMRKLTPKLLGLAVMGLGAGANLSVVLKVGAHGIGYTLVGITGTMLVGLVLGKLLQVNREAAVLIAAGTAICGGSAIAAVAPAIKASNENTSISLATVFFLNALALLIFPLVGHHWQLSEDQFGLWSALAIHDTSSVVGAALQYGAHALEIATTIKLTRALWIIPLVICIQYFFSRGEEEKRSKFPLPPWFIIGFVAMSALVSFVPGLNTFSTVVTTVSKHLLILTLFLVGASITKATLQSVGFRPILQGFVLWILVATVTLVCILTFT